MLPLNIWPQLPWPLTFDCNDLDFRQIWSEMTWMIWWHFRGQATHTWEMGGKLVVFMYLAFVECDPSVALLGQTTHAWELWRRPDHWCGKKYSKSPQILYDVIKDINLKWGGGGLCSNLKFHGEANVLGDFCPSPAGLVMKRMCLAMQLFESIRWDWTEHFALTNHPSSSHMLCRPHCQTIPT